MKHIYFVVFCYGFYLQIYKRSFLTVLPQIHPFTFGDEPANSGDTVGIQCMVTKGDVPLNITWYLNGKDATTIQGISVTKIGHKSSTLSIEAVSFIHTGLYTCYAVNRAGHANYSTELIVNGKSGLPLQSYAYYEHAPKIPNMFSFFLNILLYFTVVNMYRLLVR